MSKAPSDRKSLLLVVIFACVSSLLPIVSGQTRPLAAPETQGANLPAQPIGANDLIAVSVYDAPELTRTVRVSADGFIRLPMLKQRVKAQGLMPGDLESAIAKALQDEQIIVDPFVTVTVAEYNRHPISVAGAVRQPSLSRSPALSPCSKPSSERVASLLKPAPKSWSPAPSPARTEPLPPWSSAYWSKALLMLPIQIGRAHV